jgi:hypothetical protein
VKELREITGRDFVFAHYAAELAAPFGFVPDCYVEHVNPPYGLWPLSDGQTSVEGICAYELAMEMCDRVGVPFDRNIHNGSRTWLIEEACDRLLVHLGEDIGRELPLLKS